MEEKSENYFLGGLGPVFYFETKTVLEIVKRVILRRKDRKKGINLKLVLVPWSRYFFFFISLYIFSAVKQSKLSPFPPE